MINAVKITSSHTCEKTYYFNSVVSAILSFTDTCRHMYNVSTKKNFKTNRLSDKEYLFTNGNRWCRVELIINE